MNAKELVLDKINAGIDMIGLYLYGISIGFDIPTLSEVLMSKSSDVLQEAMEGNFISGDLAYNNYKIFEYFNKGPKNAVKLYNINPIKSGDKKDANQLNVSVNIINWMINWVTSHGMTLDDYGATGDGFRYLKEFYDRLHPKPGKKIKPITNNLISSCINDFVNLFCDYSSLNGHPLPNNNRKSEDFYEAIDYIKTNITQYSDKKTNYVLFDFIEFIKQFGRLKIELYSKNNHEATNALLILSTGSQSMQDIGLIASLNQGLPNNLETLIKKVNLFENFTLNQYKMYQRFVYGKDVDTKHDTIFKLLKVNLVRFIHDENYRKLCIKIANDYKINFNLFHMIDTLPDIKQYINALGLVDLFFKTASIRYKFIRDNFEKYYNDYLLKNDELTEAMSRYMQSVFIQEYLKDETSKGFRFPILEGSKMFINGELSNSEHSVTTMLGLDNIDNIAYFKYWMESRVIPELKTRNNKFLKALLGSSRNNTISKNELIAYTLLINMMPKKEGSNEDIIFKDYLNSFNSMNEVYEFEYTNPNTGETTTYKYNVKDLLFYYALTAFEWKPSQQSLMQIFKTSLSNRCGKVEQFFSKIREIEQSDLSVILDLYDIEPYMATKNMLSNPNAVLIWKYNIETGRRELYKRSKEESNNVRTAEDNDIDPSDIDPSYFDDYNDNDNNPDADDYIEEVNGEYIIKDPGINGYDILDTYDPNYYMFGKLGGKSNKAIDLTPLDSYTEANSENYFVKRTNNKIELIRKTPEYIGGETNTHLCTIILDNNEPRIELNPLIVGDHNTAKNLIMNHCIQVISNLDGTKTYSVDEQTIVDYLEDENPLTCTI